MSEDLLAAALSYAARGWPVLPLQPRGKGPLGAQVPHGVKDATVDEATIRRWWAAQPLANIGLATGHEFFVLDVDPRHGGADALADLERQFGPLAPTVACLTGGGGRHLYFRLPEGIALPGRLGDGLDLKNGGGYVVAPPSVHPTGGLYEWELSSHPDDMPMAEAPGWLLTLAAKPPQPEARNDRQGRIPKGERSNTLTSLAGSMRRRGMSRESIEAALLTENARRCDPPLPEAEVSTIARSVSRYEPTIDGDTEPGAQQRDYGHALVLARLFHDLYRWCVHRGSWMHYEAGVWQPVPEEAVAKAAADALRRHYSAQLAEARDKADIQDLTRRIGETCTYSRVGGALAFLRGWPGILTNAAEWDRAPWLLNLENGTLNLETCTLQPHNPADLLTQRAAAAYDPMAEAPRWERHLETFLPDSDVRRQVQRDLGLSLVGADLEELLPIWYGTGGNGKSTTLRALQAVLGDYAQMAAPRLLTASKYERHPTELAELRGARLVFSAETGEGSRMDEERVKLLTGGERIRARFMRQDFFEFARTWTITLITNHKPEIRGADNGIWRRIRLVPWTVCLPKDRQRPQEEVIGELLAERDGILSWLVAGLRDWRQDHHWRAEAVRVATDAYRAEEDILAGFLGDCCELGPRYTVAASVLYDAYVEWCARSGEDALRKDSLRRRLSARGLRKTREGHENVPTWRGVRLRQVATSDSGSPLEKAESRDHTETPVASGRSGRSASDGNDRAGDA